MTLCSYLTADIYLVNLFCDTYNAKKTTGHFNKENKISAMSHTVLNHHGKLKTQAAKLHWLMFLTMLHE